MRKEEYKEIVNQFKKAMKNTASEKISQLEPGEAGKKTAQASMFVINEILNQKEKERKKKD